MVGLNGHDGLCSLRSMIVVMVENGGENEWWFTNKRVTNRILYWWLYGA